MENDIQQEAEPGMEIVFIDQTEDENRMIITHVVQQPLETEPGTELKPTLKKTTKKTKTKKAPKLIPKPRGKKDAKKD